MLLALLFLSIAFVPKPSLSWPLGAWGDTALGYDLTTDYVNGYYGPWSTDYLQSTRWLAPGPYGLGLPGNYLYPPFPGHAADYSYGGYGPKTVDVAKENYVRDYPYGGTEFGMRDSVTVRPGGRPPYPGRFANPYVPPLFPSRAPGLWPLDRPYTPFYGDDLFADRVSPYYRMLSASGLASPRPSSLRTGGDFMFLRR